MRTELDPCSPDGSCLQMTSISTTAKYHRTDFDEDCVEAGFGGAQGGGSSGGDGAIGATNTGASVFDSPGAGGPPAANVYGAARPTPPRIYFRSQPGGCWKSRSLSERLAIAVIAVLVLAVIVLAVTLGRLRLLVIERPIVVRQNITYIDSTCNNASCELVRRFVFLFPFGDGAL